MGDGGRHRGSSERMVLVAGAHEFLEDFIV